MIRKTLAVLGISVLCLTTVAFTEDMEATQAQIDDLKEEVKDLEKRVMKTERKAALDRINFSGDFRFEVNSISSTYDDYFNGMQLQRMLVDTLFYFNGTGMPPSVARRRPELHRPELRKLPLLPRQRRHLRLAQAGHGIVPAGDAAGPHAAAPPLHLHRRLRLQE